jgi:hypothetical protein
VEEWRPLSALLAVLLLLFCRSPLHSLTRHRHRHSSSSNMQALRRIAGRGPLHLRATIPSSSSVALALLPRLSSAASSPAAHASLPPVRSFATQTQQQAQPAKQSHIRQEGGGTQREREGARKTTAQLFLSPSRSPSVRRCWPRCLPSALLSPAPLFLLPFSRPPSLPRPSFPARQRGRRPI